MNFTRFPSVLKENYYNVLEISQLRIWAVFINAQGYWSQVLIMKT